MRTKKYTYGLVSLIMTGMLLCACGQADTEPVQTEGVQKEAIPADTDKAPEEKENETKQNGDVINYKSKYGWSVVYSSKVFDVTEGDDSLKLTYKDETSGDNMEEIRYIQGKQPEEALAELTDTWNTDPEKITRRESYFPGTTDKWGYWREYSDGSSYKTAIAGEYNGGVLMFYSTEIISNEEVSPVSDALAEVLNSIKYDNFGPQTMYDHIPGKYVMTYTDNIGGTDISIEYYIELRDDHTGTMSLQDNVQIMWGSNELMRTEPDYEKKYEYSIEGNSLNLNLDGYWMTFEKMTFEKGSASDNTDAVSNNDSANAVSNDDSADAPIENETADGFMGSFLLSSDRDKIDTTNDYGFLYRVVYKASLEGNELRACGSMDYRNSKDQDPITISSDITHIFKVDDNTVYQKDGENGTETVTKEEFAGFLDSRKDSGMYFEVEISGGVVKTALLSAQ